MARGRDGGEIEAVVRVRYGREVVGPRRRPCLFLDVDGVLIPFGGITRTTAHDRSAVGGEANNGGNPFIARIKTGIGPALAALPYDLVWATTWESEANDSLAVPVGLPHLRVVTWPDDSPAAEERDIAAGRHWKTRPLVAWAAERPFAWLDDEITDRDQYWVTTHHPAPTLLHRIDAMTGLTDDDIDILARWARSLGDR